MQLAAHGHGSWHPDHLGRLPELTATAGRVEMEARFLPRPGRASVVTAAALAAMAVACAIGATVASDDAAHRLTTPGSPDARRPRDRPATRP